MKPIYLDYNATTPIAPEVAAAMRPYLEEHFGNPSSTHWYGIQTKNAVEQARRQVAALIGCFPDEIIFTSGGSESNNMAIRGIALERANWGRHIITSSIEHPAVTEVCADLEASGFSVSYVPVDSDGLIDPEDFQRAITPQTTLLTVMHANNEVGTVQPIAALARIARERGIAVHSDAAQSAGKIPVHVDELGVDLLSIAGHKLYAPKGVGALYIRRGTQLKRLIFGANHERGLRAGTENVLEIVGLGTACELAARDMDANILHLRGMRDRLYEGLLRELGYVPLNGHPELRLPNTLSVSFPHVEANTLLSEVQEIAASAGAACHSDTIELSSVLTAMGKQPDQAMGTVRFSTGRATTAEEIDRATEIVVRAVQRLQPDAFAPSAAVAEDETIKLTQFTHGLGCACKLRPQALEEVLAKLTPPLLNDDVLIGTNTSDDAAVYRIDENTAIVQTLDFFTPIVDDPYTFGAIAAANALSDIYAMGATPLFALNIVGFPSGRLPLWVLHRILEGASDKAREAGIPILGGHTVDDTEPKFGMAVTGRVHPQHVVSNAGAQAGDMLILTKPIGTGILTTAMKRGLLDEHSTGTAIETMCRLNKTAAEVMNHFPVHACTDITGFGFLGHLKELTQASEVDAEVYASAVPVLPGVLDQALAGVIPGGTQNNLEFVSPMVTYTERIPQHIRFLLCDAQTSGGLLFAMPADVYAEALAWLHGAGIADAAIVGSITRKGNGTIHVLENKPEP